MSSRYATEIASDSGYSRKTGAKTDSWTRSKTSVSPRFVLKVYELSDWKHVVVARVSRYETSESPHPGSL